MDSGAWRALRPASAFRLSRVIIGLPLLLSLSDCNTTPIALSSRYTPSRIETGHGKPALRICKVSLADVRDVRSDPQAMGTIGVRNVRAPDTVTWLRSGIESLSTNDGIRFVKGTEVADADLVLSVELVKAYIMSITTEKSTNVVLRVRLGSGSSVFSEKIYRGADTSLNWSNGEGETQSSFDRAFAQLLKELYHDILAQCGSSVDASPGRNSDRTTEKP